MPQRLLPMGEIDRRLRVSAVRQALVPMECRASWLTPLLSDNAALGERRIYLRGFLYPVAGLANQAKRVLRPRFEWTIDPITAIPVEIVDCAYRDFARKAVEGEEVGILTPDLLPAPTVEGLEAFRTEVMQAFDAVLPAAFAAPADMTPEARAAAGRLRQILQRAIEPFLMPVYRALNTAFLDWLEQFQDRA